MSLKSGTFLLDEYEEMEEFDEFDELEKFGKLSEIEEIPLDEALSDLEDFDTDELEKE